ncbi:MAG: D-alanine--D-alanine ligase [Lactobacillales bacterium]|jgi:D-alanine-D-alanine ligase|nr:D-alanine--D-alanine ligase [Lactobacillales bacterium]
MKLILLYGGKSAEHDVAISSAYTVIQAADYARYSVELVYISNEGKWRRGATLTSTPRDEKVLKEFGDEVHPLEVFKDVSDTVVFPVLHGPNGEDGTLQGFLEVLEVPYVGCGVLASAAGMDKIVAKQIFDDIDIPLLPSVATNRYEWKHNREEVLAKSFAELDFPIFVKPANMGSSVGISKIEKREDLEPAIDLAFKFDNRVMIEKGAHVREIEVAVLGNYDAKASLPGEIVKDVEFYDYSSKYLDNKIIMDIPAKISEETTKKIQEYAVKAYNALDCSGLTRCDFFLTQDNQIYLNEVNTMPGFTPFSMYPVMWEKMGVSNAELIERLIGYACERFELRKSLTTEM